MKIDRYTKVVLTIIAVGIIGLNVHFFKDDFIKEAHAVDSHSHYPVDIKNFNTLVQTTIQGECVINEKITYDGYYIRCFQGNLSTN
jgi:hypothetical protein